MYVQIHSLFEKFQAALEADLDASVVHSLGASPRLGDFLEDLDPNLSLDWSAQSFQGMPALRQKILARTGLADSCTIEDVLITEI